jgi:hypothetical protein
MTSSTTRPNSTLGLVLVDVSLVWKGTNLFSVFAILKKQNIFLFMENENAIGL